MARLLSSTLLRRPLEVVIAEKGLITQEHLDRYVRNSKESQKPLEEILIKEAGLSEKQVYQALAESFGFNFAENIETVALDKLPERISNLCSKELILISSLEEKNIKVATFQPNKISRLESLLEALGYTVEFVIIPPEKIKKTISADKISKQNDELFSGISTLAYSLKADEGEKGFTSEKTHDISSEFETSSVIELVNKTLMLAVQQKVSDVHVESIRTGAKVRFRIDGVLSDRFDLDGTTASAFVSRLLIMSELDITEKIMPQDGGFKVSYNDRDVEFRIACIPGIWGQNIVLRLLSGAESQKLSLDSLGMLPDELSLMKDTTRFPHGMILVAGPTGSGKSTTLYSVLENIADPKMKFITIEDPVERRIDGVQQIQVRINRNEPDRSLTFARGLRTILRLDPDIIMVGEIRDADTAQISVQASLTGHLVLSTVHANSSVETLRRLQNIGIDFHLLMSSLNLIFSQRLMRKLCPHCKQSKQTTDREKELLKNLQSAEIYTPQGCPHCFNSGYKGRIGIFEFLPIDELTRDLIAQNGLTESIMQIREKRLRTLQESGLIKIAEGLTDFGELERVCGPCL